MRIENKLPLALASGRGGKKEVGFSRSKIRLKPTSFCHVTSSQSWRQFTFAFVKRLPNLAALVRRANHRVAELALISLGEGGHVRERAVDSESAERVRVCL